MRRRQFISAASAALAYGLMPKILAQEGTARPKVFLFGRCIIQKKITGLFAHLPMNHYHRAFALGSKAHLESIFGVSVNDASQSLKRIHDDLPLEKFVCVPLGDTDLDIEGDGDTVFSNAASAAIPNLIDVAKKIKNQTYSLKLPKDSLEIKLSGGELRLPYHTSRAAGTKGIVWRFCVGDKEYGDAYHLTDLLVFESNTMELKLDFEKRDAVTLGPGAQLWLLNLPTQLEGPEKDETGKVCKDMPEGEARNKCFNVIENAHHVFENLTNHEDLPSGVLVRSHSKFTRLPAPDVPEFKHPCLDQKVYEAIRARYIPPDTDPCFATQV